MSNKNIRSSVIFSLLIMVLFGFTNLAGIARAADNERVKVVTVTVKDKAKSPAPALSGDDFLVSEDGRQQEILSVKPASEAEPLSLAIVIEDDIAQINNELPAIKRFITGLPTGSQVMVAYLQGNFVNIAQPFTTDLNQAAKSLHVVSGTRLGAPSSPYIDLMDVMKKFNGKQQGRNEILFVSNGFDALNRGGLSPESNPYLARAIKFAQQENITIFSIYASASTAFNARLNAFSLIGQGALNSLSTETGGYAFFMGSGFVSFDAPLAELSNMLNHQYVISYKSNADKGFHTIKVKTDFSNIEIEAAKGYKS
jgi:VWFA-related protein